MKLLEKYIKQLELAPDVEDVVRKTLAEEERNWVYIKTRRPSILRDLEEMVRDVAKGAGRGAR